MIIFSIRGIIIIHIIKAIQIHGHQLMVLCFQVLVFILDIEHIHLRSQIVLAVLILAILVIGLIISCIQVWHDFWIIQALSRFSRIVLKSLQDGNDLFQAHIIEHICDLDVGVCQVCDGLVALLKFNPVG